jgi:hypothetical protein
MKKNLILYFILAITILTSSFFIFLAYSKPMLENEYAKLTVHPVLPDYSIENIIEDHSNNHDGCELNFKRSYPQITLNNKNNIESAINKHIESFSYFSSGTDFTATAKEYCYPDFVENIAEELNIDAEIQNKILKLKKYHYSYLGGAHPNTETSFLNINLDNANPILLKDLFNTENYAEKIYPLVLETLNENLDEEEWWNLEERIAETNNFYIEDNRLMILFNPYEIASYAAGPHTTSIKLEDTSDILNEEIIKLFIKN